MLIIDRFEGEYAVCEDSDTEQYHNIPKVLLPHGVGEGDCLRPGPQEGQWIIDTAETARRRALLKKRLEDLYR